ncbi:DUF2834 domain-containing protein [Streptomyces sp. JB150]|uniref:DUF2834 domain-containing protein n=1 Tax=Streptomyces sp. JB150 TaxID=2714844 RepID=UPI001F1036FA|nr:DUF2834 domain-containing protein [Streptomyces sp. JB150]
MPTFSELRGRDRSLCLFHALFALGGFLVMGAMAVTFVVRNADAGPLGLVGNFLDDSLDTLAGRFVYADLFLIWAGLGVWMVTESRRWGIRHVWAYIVGAPALALCVSFAVFMYVRQLHIVAARARREDLQRTAPVPSFDHPPTKGSRA